MLYDLKASATGKTVSCDQDFCTAMFNAPYSECRVGSACEYQVTYGDGSSTSGYFVKDYIHLDQVSGDLQTTSINGSIAFGCERLALDGFKRIRGRPKKYWREVIKHDMERLQLTEDMTLDRKAWSLNNAPVMGIPVLHAMSPQVGVDLLIQSLAILFLIWSIIIQFMMELRNAKNEIMACDDVNQDLEGHNYATSSGTKTPFLGSVMKVVWIKLSKNPNFYACFLGMMWSLVSDRWHFGLPNIVKECISIMSKAGSGIGMFTIGVFVAMLQKILASGTGVIIFGLFLRFFIGPAAMTIGPFIVGLHGNV
ncbi:hypothetical protein FXO38_29282 [Capsicum annuum]|nr:hypothetical protein FXO38_29282 [Capsicum annuum]